LVVGLKTRARIAVISSFIDKVAIAMESSQLLIFSGNYRTDRVAKKERRAVQTGGDPVAPLFSESTEPALRHNRQAK
jgi:hypothetical protein